jgi:hypothetical protein
MNTWYGQTIKDMQSYNAQIAAQVTQLKAAFADMQSIQSQINSVSTTTTGSKIASTTQKIASVITSKISTHHEGGVVGESGNKTSDFINKLFNVKPTEEISKLLKGEVVVPTKNFPNFITNVRNMVSSILGTPQLIQAGDSITLNNVTIQTENASTFLPDLQRIINTRKS